MRQKHSDCNSLFHFKYTDAAPVLSCHLPPSSPYLVIFLSLPIMSVPSPMERQRKRGGQRQGGGGEKFIFPERTTFPGLYHSSPY